MTKAEIYKQAKRLIECGKPKQEVFEEMSFVGVKTPKKLAQMIRRISSFENRKKFVFLSGFASCFCPRFYCCSRTFVTVCKFSTRQV
jgi:hypothetical protein